MKIVIIGFLVCCIAMTSIECRPAAKKNCIVMRVRWHGIKCLDMDKKLTGKNEIQFVLVLVSCYNHLSLSIIETLI